jgi:hypothetical protein
MAIRTDPILTSTTKSTFANCTTIPFTTTNSLLVELATVQIL